jgi:antitoxin component YwqK of YwqJK toxin-antitoxin module
MSNVRNGEVKTFWERGNIRRLQRYKDGKLEGEQNEWNVYGLLMSQGFYKDGKLEGEYTSWADNGAVYSRAYYKDDKLDGEYTIMHLHTGQMKARQTYKAGVLDGVSEKWYEGGQIFEQCSYRDYKEEGEYRKWHVNGQLFVQCFYKGGNIDGEYRMWNDLGHLVKRCNYKDGVEYIPPKITIARKTVSECLVYHDILLPGQQYRLCSFSDEHLFSVEGLQGFDSGKCLYCQHPLIEEVYIQE